MALTIEDGTGKADADSYATAAELATYAANYGVTVPATEAEQEVLLRRAAVAMNALAWKGERAVSGQALAWPRSGVTVHGLIVDDDVIPREIQYGQMALAAEIAGYDAAPPSEAKGAVVREKVDVLEVQYAAVDNTGKVLPVGADAPSKALFADYLNGRGWNIAAVRA